MMSKLKKFVSVLSIPIVVYSGYQVFDAYNYSKSPSKFQLAAERLGFHKEAEQESLLRVLHFGGYLKPEGLWRDINKIGKIQDPEKIFKTIYRELSRSKADQDNPSKFKVKSLRKNLFKDSDLDVQDVKDLLLYMAQHAFNRKPGKERNELTAQNWIEKHKTAYWESARELGLIDSIEPPQYAEYQFKWIAGASRIGVFTRLLYDDYITSLKGIKVTGKTSILAGGRELWANIDGISPQTYAQLLKIKQNKTNIDDSEVTLSIGEDPERTAEGRKYMLQLAEENGILLDRTRPFVQCNKEDCSPGRFPGRDYANYVNKDGAKLTESMMSSDLLRSFFPDQDQVIVDTASINNQRPNTATTARDAARIIAEEIIAGKYGDKKSFKILYITNNPYIERQTLATQQEVNKVLSEYKLNTKGYTIALEGVGFRCKQDVATVHSEFGALFTEKWKLSTNEDQLAGIVPKRDISSLLFQSRDNESSTPEMPDVDVFGGLNLKDTLISWFDENT